MTRCPTLPHHNTHTSQEYITFSTTQRTPYVTPYAPYTPNHTTSSHTPALHTIYHIPPVTIPPLQRYLTTFETQDTNRSSIEENPHAAIAGKNPSTWTEERSAGFSICFLGLSQCSNFRNFAVWIITSLRSVDTTGHAIQSLRCCILGVG